MVISLLLAAFLATVLSLVGSTELGSLRHNDFLESMTTVQHYAPLVDGWSSSSTPRASYVPKRKHIWRLLNDEKDTGERRQLIVGGGFDGNEVLEDIEPLSQGHEFWKKSFPEPLAFPFFTYLGEKIVACGTPKSEWNELQLINGSAQYMTSCWHKRKDLDGPWHTLNTFPLALVGSAHVTYQNSIWYTFGGFELSSKEFSNQVLALHEDSKDWQVIGHLPNGLVGACAVIQNQTVFLSGGHTYDRVFQNIWKFDVRSPEWKEVGAMQVPRAHHACVTTEIAGNQVVISAGGFHLGPRDMFQVLNSVEVFYPNGQVKDLANIPSLTTPRLGFRLFMPDEGKLMAVGGLNQFGTLGTCEVLKIHDDSANWELTQNGCLRRPRAFFASMESTELTKHKRSIEKPLAHSNYLGSNAYPHDMDNFYSSEDEEDYLPREPRDKTIPTLANFNRGFRPVQSKPDVVPKVILLGGLNVKQLANMDSMSKVNEQGIFTANEHLPEKSRMLIAGHLSGYLVVCGGTSSPYSHEAKLGDLKVSSDCFQKSTEGSARSAWEKFGPLPIPVLAASTAVANNTLYIIGGYERVGEDKEVFHQTAMTLTLDGHGAPTFVPNVKFLKMHRAGAASLVYEERYVLTIAGHNATGYHNCLEIYDTKKHERFYKGIWKLNFPRAYHACAVVKSFQTAALGVTDAILCAGGIASGLGSSSLDLVDSIEYWHFGKFIEDKKKHKWHVMDQKLNKPRFALALVRINWNQTAVVGGTNFEDTELPGEIVDNSNVKSEIKEASKLSSSFAFTASVLFPNGPNSLTFKQSPITLELSPSSSTASTTLRKDNPSTTIRPSDNVLNDDVVILSEANPDVDTIMDNEIVDNGILLINSEPRTHGTRSDYLVPGRYTIPRILIDLPRTRMMAMGGFFESSNLIVLCGGYSSNMIPKTFSNDGTASTEGLEQGCFAYSLDLKSWHKIPAMKTPLAECAFVMQKHMLFMFGGIQPKEDSNAIEEYCESQTSTWFSRNIRTLSVNFESKTSELRCSEIKLPLEAAGGCAVALEDDVFILGGRNSWRIHRTVYKLTTQGNNSDSHLSKLPIMNEGRSSLGCSLVIAEGSKMLFAGGGYSLSLLSKNGLKSIEMLNIGHSSSSWITVGQMKQPRFGFTMENKLHLNTILMVGGLSSNGLVEQMEGFEFNERKSSPVCGCPLSMAYPLNLLIPLKALNPLATSVSSKTECEASCRHRNELKHDEWSVIKS
ncbi:uncharacterized protein LOC131884457 isoform X1 [Tigriopus californicus]|uniref:uncharacterized protein LOC131884457 isoform X1 n=3 Tax=Tigriopus californicus TaxID=6832 RepID=UPI0027DAB340|nr:uncharacterized protein LOC131884457 isoform X1 [Tigriopus californicus]